MAKKRTNEIQTPETRLGKTIAAIATCLVVIFAIVCYFNPSVYDWFMSIFNDDNKPEYRVEGDTTIVSQTDFRDLEVHFVDVGQGDAVLIKLPDFKNVLIDSGPDLNNEDDTNEVVEYIKSKGVTTLDYVLATHSDADHVANMNEIFAEFEVKHVFRPYVKATSSSFTFDDNFNLGNKTHGTKTYAEFLTAIKNETYGKDETSTTWEYFTDRSDFAGKVKIEETNEVYEYYFDFLSPTKSLEELTYNNLNDYSPIVRFSYQGFDFMFSGDAEKEAENDFVNYYNTLSNVDFDVEVMKAGHHGSKTSTSQAILDVFKPEYMVVQCGFGNSYGHPDQDFLDRITATSNMTLLRNDLYGDIVFTINSQGQIKDQISLETPNIYGTECLYMTGPQLVAHVNKSALLSAFFIAIILFFTTNILKI